MPNTNSKNIKMALKTAKEDLDVIVSGSEVTIMGKIPVRYDYKSERGCETCKSTLKAILKIGGYTEKGDEVSFRIIFPEMHIEKNEGEKEVIMGRNLTRASPVKTSINPSELYIDMVFMARKSGYADESSLSYKVKFQKKK